MECNPQRSTSNTSARISVQTLVIKRSSPITRWCFACTRCRGLTRLNLLEEVVALFNFVHLSQKLFPLLKTQALEGGTLISREMNFTKVSFRHTSTVKHHIVLQDFVNQMLSLCRYWNAKQNVPQLSTYFAQMSELFVQLHNQDIVMSSGSRRPVWLFQSSNSPHPLENKTAVPDCWLFELVLTAFIVSWTLKNFVDIIHFSSLLVEAVRVVCSLV